MNTIGYAAKSAGDTLEEINFEISDPKDFEIILSVSFCGICHSDIHLISNSWGISRFPFIPGHEVVGIIEKVGPLVKHLKTGERVGVGWQAGACMVCDLCLSGQHQLCSTQEATCVGRNGGFAQKVKVDSRFAFKIPDGLSSENAAPLLCGGITVFSPFLNFNIQPIHQIGVIGIGGLGHLALQFARAYGCEVYAFSQSKDKTTEAKNMGAHHFVDSSIPQNLRNLKGKLDFIINTTHADLDWDAFISCLRENGKLCFLGVPGKSLSLPVGRLLSGRKAVTASPIGSPFEIIRMLEFAARHNIKAMTEVVPLNQVNNALKKVRENKARYRMVLKVNE